MRRAWWAIVLVALLGLAWATRYQPMIAEGVPMAWDRWGHRYCLSQHGDWHCGIHIRFP